jgi:hypothetical protein
MIPPSFREVWFVDTEFSRPDGERPTPICLVARERYSGRVIRQWLWGSAPPPSPFRVGPDVLLVAYSATAEWSVFLALDWRLPVRVLDLHAEYRWLNSGFKLPHYGQLDAMDAFGIPHMDELFKIDMRAVCCRGGPFSPSEEREILAYCEQDVDGLAALFQAMEKDLEWPQALARGRFTVAVARVEYAGLPLDRKLYPQFAKHREGIRQELIRGSGEQFGIYDETKFDTKAFENFLIREDIPWPLTPTGRLVTREKTFEEMVDVYPQLRPVHELRTALGQLKTDGGLAAGRDGRNRTELWPFGTSTGRNAPSTTKFVFGKSTAFRSFVKPDPGWAVAYVDWAQ